MSNPHEDFNRLKKANKLAAVIREEGFTVAQVEKFSPQQRLTIALAAKTKEPSDATWAVVIRLLKLEEHSWTSNDSDNDLFEV